MAVPTLTVVTLTFKTDSLILRLDESGTIGETMSYVVKDSMITIKKISGGSPCSNDVFTVKYKIINDQLFITTITDPCEQRKDSWPKEPFYRIKK